MKTLNAAVLKHPSISDEEVERILNLSFLKGEAPAVLILDLFSTPRDGRSSPAPWPVSRRRAAPTSR